MAATAVSDETSALLRRAASDKQHVSGLTHRFYRYPARFSPAFARACIQSFSVPGDLVLDPYMGGGTTVVEAMVLGRQAIGSDINSLSVFIAHAKSSRLTESERHAIHRWATEIVPAIRCRDAFVRLIGHENRKPRNMASPETRWLRKTISLCMVSIDAHLLSARARKFASCVLLNVGQWALNGRRRIPNTGEFRERVTSTTAEMLAGAVELANALAAAGSEYYDPILRQNDAEHIDRDPVIRSDRLVDLVVTSPPYPGIHMLYHRWQVDGRKETDAPYWIAACTDGSGAAYYNFADRKVNAESRYFEKAVRSFSAIRRVVRSGAVVAQMVAFSDPRRQLRRYLDAMKAAGFEEMRQSGMRRTWREVPSRRWYANLKGELSSAKEVFLLHVAV